MYPFAAGPRGRGPLNEKTVVVTGASSGAGRAIATAFAREGVRLGLTARREAALEEVADECRQLGAADVLVLAADVTEADSVHFVAKVVKEWSGRIDVWVNNAGVLAAGGFTDTPIEVWDRVVQTNLLGYMHGAHAVLPIFKEQRFGMLINNISVGGWLPVPYATGYSAAKFGLRGFSEALRGELHAWPHIHICDAFPGFLDTPGILHAANYTGKYLKPAPPVYDPGKLARAIVRVAKNPQSAVTVGGFTHFLRLSHFLLPRLTRAITARVIENYLKIADPVPPTSGNLFEPQDFGTGALGGWRQLLQPSRRTMANAALIGGGILALLAFAGRKR